MGRWGCAVRISVQHNIDTVMANLSKGQSQVAYATSVAINKTADLALRRVRAEMPKVFLKPTPWVLNSLRVKRSTKTKLTAELAYKDSWSSSAGEIGGKTMIAPHVYGGGRALKGLEVRLNRVGILPFGWYAVPGRAAKLDAYGNMNRGQITTLLNVLGTYTEGGYNKANAKTRARLAKGNAKRGVYGYAYWVNYVDWRGVGHIPPGVYQRVQTPFGSSLKPILIFVKGVAYKKRLPFYELVQQVTEIALPVEFRKAFDEAMKTALLKNQGTLL